MAGAFNLTASSPTDKGENPGADPRTVAELDAYFERAKQHKRLIAAEVIMNVAYYAGDQEAVWESIAGRLRRVDMPWRSGMFHNIVKATIIAQTAKIVKNKPGWRCAPFGSDEQQVAAAKGGEHLLDYYYRKGGLRACIQDALISADIAGIAWVKAVWDWSKGRDLDTLEGTWMYGPSGKTPENSGSGGFFSNTTPPGVVSESEQTGAAPSTNPSFISGGEYAGGSGVTTNLKEGDISFSVVDFFMGFPDPNQLRPGDPAQRFMEVHRLTRREVQARWPQRAKFVQATPIVADDQFGTVYQSAVFEGILGYGSPAEQGRDSANEIILVKEYCELPSPAHPDGRMVQYAHNTVLFDGPLPAKRIHYFPIWHVKHPRRYWPIPLATELRTLNHEYNRVRRQEIEYMELHGKGVWLNPVGSGVPKEAFIARHGLILNYRPVGFNKPEQVQLKPFPPTEEMLNRVIGDAQEAASVREISKGYAPPNVGAASALNILQEQDETSTAPITQDIEDCVAAIGEHVLELIHDNMQFPRQLEIAGETGEWQIQSFDRSNVQPWKVYVESGSMLPKSKYAAVQTFSELWDKGLIVDENGMPDYKMAARMLQGEFYRPEVFRDDRIATEMIERENQDACDGQPLSVMPEENHDQHVQGHSRKILALKFKRDPQSQMAILALRQHIQQHLMALMAQMPPEPPPVSPASPGGGPGAGGPGAPPSPKPTPPGMNPQAPRGSIEPHAKAVGLNRPNGGLG